MTLKSVQRLRPGCEPRRRQTYCNLGETIKGYGMGASGEGQNVAHQAKKMDKASLKQFRDRFDIPVTDEQIDSGDLPYLTFAPDSEEYKYLHARREALGGYLPQRHPTKEVLEVPELSAFDAQLKSSGDREFSTTMAFVRILSTLLKDKKSANALYLSFLTKAVLSGWKVCSANMVFGTLKVNNTPLKIKTN